jgi:heme-degrading monooxygenase HmoA
MLHAKVRPDDVPAFEDAFRVVTERMRAAEGHIQDELIRESGTESPSYIVLSEWESQDAFLRWLHAPRHQGEDSPLSPYWYDTRVQIFELAYRLDDYEPRAVIGENA